MPNSCVCCFPRLQTHLSTIGNEEMTRIYQFDVERWRYPLFKLLHIILSLKLLRHFWLMGFGFWGSPRLWKLKFSSPLIFFYIFLKMHRNLYVEPQAHIFIHFLKNPKVKKSSSPSHLFEPFSLYFPTDPSIPKILPPLFQHLYELFEVNFMFLAISSQQFCTTTIHDSSWWPEDATLIKARPFVITCCV